MSSVFTWISANQIQHDEIVKIERNINLKTLSFFSDFPLDFSGSQPLAYLGQTVLLKSIFFSWKFTQLLRKWSATRRRLKNLTKKKTSWENEKIIFLLNNLQGSKKVSCPSNFSLQFSSEVTDSSNRSQWKVFIQKGGQKF